jgi:hypothetical protein
MGLTARDLNVPVSKMQNTINYLRNLPYDQKIVTGSSGTDHVLMYIVSGRGTHPHLDITGHRIVYKNGERIDQTAKAGGKAGAALFNVHVNFTGVSEATRAAQMEQMARSKENRKVFEAKMKAEDAKKEAAVTANPFALLGDADD